VATMSPSSGTESHSGARNRGTFWRLSWSEWWSLREFAVGAPHAAEEDEGGRTWRRDQLTLAIVCRNLATSTCDEVDADDEVARPRALEEDGAVVADMAELMQRPLFGGPIPRPPEALRIQPPWWRPLGFPTDGFLLPSSRISGAHFSCTVDGPRWCRRLRNQNSEILPILFG
jgi:hypothetical protein